MRSVISVDPGLGGALPSVSSPGGRVATLIFSARSSEGGATSVAQLDRGIKRIAGPGRPLKAVTNARSNVGQKSRARAIRPTNFEIPPKNPLASTARPIPEESWKAPRPSPRSGDWPTRARTGTDSAYDSAIPTARFNMPPPDVEQQTPSRRCTRAYPSAMNAAPDSDFAITETSRPLPRRWIASCKCSMFAPLTPNTKRTSRASKASTMASASFMRDPYRAAGAVVFRAGDPWQLSVP